MQNGLLPIDFRVIFHGSAGSVVHYRMWVANAKIHTVMRII